jgi:iron complex outermembrane receptor protein
LQGDKTLKNKNKNRIFIVITALFTANSAFAQLEEVLVTAQKREQNLQDVPIAISAVNQELLEQTGVNTITEVIPMVAGLSGADYGLATNTWAIRGIGSNDWTIGSEPSVGVFIDDAYVGRNIFATSNFFDINRIEVVKGPQGTLFGRNAAAGAISLVTNKPGDGDELHLGLSMGDEGQRRYELVGNWALSDSFALRLAYQNQKWEGMWTEVNSGQEMYTESDVLRLSARWDISDNLEALFKYNKGDAETNYTSAVSILTNPAQPGVEYPDRFAINQPNFEQNKDDGFGLRLTWSLSDSLTLVSITDSRSGENDYFEDVDGTADDITIDEAVFGVPGGAVGGLNIPVGLGGDADSFYQEFRLSGGSEAIDWFAGASYYSEDLDNSRWEVDYVATALGFPVGSQRISSKAENESMGIYGDITWQASDQLALTAGARWSSDDKDWCTNTLQDDFGEAGGPTPGELCETKEWDELTSRFIAQYNVSDDTMMFASVSQGYKGGGFNTSVADLDGDFIAETIIDFDPETSIAYELGFKSTMMEGRMQLNGSFYVIDYEALQFATLTLETGLQIANAGDVDSRGFEIELNYAPNDSVLLMANYANSEAEVGSGALNGQTLAYAPQATYSLGAMVDQPFASGTLNWFAMYNYTGDYFHDMDNFLEEDGYGVMNAKVTYIPSSEAWDFAIAVDNLTDQDYATLRGDFGWGPMLHWGYKRMIRAELNMHF